MTIELEMYLNQIAQEVVPTDEALQWFNDLKDSEQLDMFQILLFIILQAGALADDADRAVTKSGLRPTFTPCVLLYKVQREQPFSQSALQQVLLKIVNLPANEKEKSFRLLIALFQVADARRRERCFEPERHWWHRDLSDKNVVAEILAVHGVKR